MPQSRRSPMLVPEGPVRGIKPLLGIGQIQLKPREQPSRSLDLALFFVKRFVEPASRIFASSGAERADNFVEFTRLKFLNLVLPIYDDCQRRCLNAAK